MTIQEASPAASPNPENMAVDIPVVACPPMSPELMESHHSVIISTLRGNVKLIKLEDKETLIKGFGVISSSALIGKPFGLAYELLSSDNIRALTREEVLAERGDKENAEECGNNNREINDEGDKTQLLTLDDIEELKRKIACGDVSSRNAIESIAQSNQSFEKKTEYSKAKYIAKKARKFVKIFYALPTTTRNMCDYYNAKNTDKILDLQTDTLASILARANIHENCRVLVLDTTGGLLTGAVMARMNGTGTVVHLHEHVTPALDIVQNMNFDKSQMDTLLCLPFQYIHGDMAPEQELHDRLKLAKCNKRQRSMRTRFYKLQRAKATMQPNFFDALLIASRFDPMTVVPVLEPFLKLSRPLVLYHSNLQPMMTCYVEFRQRGDLVNVSLTQPFTRRYQVLPNRTHPENNMNGISGFVLAATKVVAAEIPAQEQSNSGDAGSSGATVEEKIAEAAMVMGTGTAMVSESETTEPPQGAETTIATR